MTRKAPPFTARASAPAALHIFRAGRHVDMAGQQIDFTEADLAATCAAYDPAKHEAPLTIGHPRHDLPAYGWVAGLSATANGIDAQPAQVDPAFAEMHAAGRFKKISASFYTPESPNNPVPGCYYLRHVGFLGAQPPAIKGLRPAEFAEDEAGVITFGETEPPPPEKTHMDHEQMLADITAENTRLRSELAANIAAQTHAAHTAFCEAVPGLAPAHLPTAVAMLDQLAAQDTPVNFGEGEDARPLADKFRELLMALPPVVSFGEVATGQRAVGAAGADVVNFAAAQGYSVDSAKLAELGRAKAYQAAHKVDFVTAVAAVRAAQA